MAGNSKKSKSKKKNKIIKYKRKPSIVLAIFAVILVYVICFVAMYMSKSKVQVYSVDMGSISTNAEFTGIAIRNEKVYNSQYAGNINYYKKEGTKVKVGDTIYTVDETGRVAEILAEYTKSGENSLSKDSLATIKSMLNSFRTGYDGSNFRNIYDLKAEINSEVLYAMNANIMNNLESIIESTGSENLFRTIVSDQPGIIAYYIDGYEGINAENITKTHFNKDNYNKQNLKAEELIVNDSPAYKLVTGEEWYVLIPLTQEDIIKYDLSDKSSVTVKFKKDNITALCGFSIIMKEDEMFGKISLNKYSIRYVNDRFLDIELMSSTRTGLKIPVSAITDCEFYTIPKEFLTTGGNSNNDGFICETYDTSGNVQTQFVSATVYKTIDDMCYISTDAITAGANVVMPDSSKRYTVGPIAKLKGVYCVNSGYTDFKLVEIIDENSEYVISKKGIANGISLYDRIILDATKYTVNDMVY
ncbi:MAG: hypothetical protein IJB96_03975 [Lachnospira sp.]|nr:hypothetical protein [Lachnospira sp.]